MSAPDHQAHGLTRTPAPPAWPRIGSEFAAILSAWPQLGAMHDISWHAPRPFAATARVETDAGPIFVKRHHPKLRSVTDLSIEHRFASHLAPRLRSLAIPCAIPTPDGTTAIAAAGWSWEILPPVPGDDRHRDTLSWEPATTDTEAYEAGVALAKFHDAAGGFDEPSRAAPWLIGRLAPLDAPDPLATLHSTIATTPTLAAALAPWPDWQDTTTRILSPWLRAYAANPPQPPLWTHGDWHISNLLWRDDSQVASILDLGLCDRTTALFDLATALERNTIAWLDLGARASIAQPSRAAALLAGYHQHRPLDSAARAQLSALLPVVHLGFALSEIGYFHALLDDPAAVTLAYEGFLLAHTDWFASTDGRALLAALG